MFYSNYSNSIGFNSGIWGPKGTSTCMNGTQNSHTRYYKFQYTITSLSFFELRY